MSFPIMAQKLCKPTKRGMSQFRVGFLPQVVVAAILAIPLTAWVVEDANIAGDVGTIAGSGGIQTGNMFCPVMPENRVNPEVYYDYKGRRIYFCCLSCRSAFKKNPEEYVSRLPQFAQTLPHIDHVRGHGGAEAGLTRFIKPMGVTTMSLLVLTVVAGLFRRRNAKLLLKWHKRLGITTVISAIIHATLVLVAH